MFSGCVQPDYSGIRSFEDCEKAGYPVMESYPRQCRTPDGRTFISGTDFIDSNRNMACSVDPDCVLVNKELGFGCCYAGACQPINHSDAKWIAVNKAWFDSVQDMHCPDDCGPAPGCAVQVLNDSFEASCIGGSCVKTG